MVCTEQHNRTLANNQSCISPIPSLLASSFFIDTLNSTFGFIGYTARTTRGTIDIVISVNLLGPPPLHLCGAVPERHRI